MVAAVVSISSPPTVLLLPMQVMAMLQLKDEEAARDKAQISAHYLSQIQAVHVVERAAARVSTRTDRLLLSRSNTNAHLYFLPSHL